MNKLVLRLYFAAYCNNLNLFVTFDWMWCLLNSNNNKKMQALQVINLFIVFFLCCPIGTCAFRSRITDSKVMCRSRIYFAIFAFDFHTHVCGGECNSRIEEYKPIQRKCEHECVQYKPRNPFGRIESNRNNKKKTNLCKNTLKCATKLEASLVGS